jgi:hypothetical protein
MFSRLNPPVLFELRGRWLPLYSAQFRDENSFTDNPVLDDGLLTGSIGSIPRIGR